jgi:hypothetical protein
MKLREQYERDATGPVPWEDKEILNDDEDSFSYLTQTKNGKPLVVGWNRASFIWWRNQDPNAD